MASQNTEKEKNLLKAYAVAIRSTRKFSILVEKINALLLDSILGVNSSREDSPTNSQRKEEEDYLNAFLNHEDFDDEVLQHFSSLISRLRTLNGGNEQEQINDRESQITDGSIQVYNGPRLVPHSSQTKPGQNNVSNKRKNGTKPEIPGPSSKIPRGNSLNGHQNEEIYNESHHEVDETEFTLPQTPQPPAGVTPRHTSLSRAEYTIATNDSVGSWVDSNSETD